MKYCIHCMQAMAEGDEHCAACGKSQEIAVPEHHLKPGSILNGKYLVGSAIGEGGFGITYIGRDTLLEMRVAVKEYYPNGLVSRAATSVVQPAVSEERAAVYRKGMERFLQEARTLAMFSGEPGIVDVRDFFEANGTAYLVMAYLEGETLRQYLRRCGRMTAEDAVQLLLPVMHSLQKIHEKGLIHRDISPDNIMLVDGKPKLIDFGAARSVMDGSNRSLSVMLKPGYAPEEQYRSRGEQGPWTDVYALSATIYRCITGKVADEAAERMRADTVKRPSELGAVISPACEAALMKGMAVRKEDRYQSVEALLAGLQGKDAQDEERTVYRTQTEPSASVQQVTVPGNAQQPVPPVYPQQPAPPVYPQQPAPPVYPQQPVPPVYPQQPAPPVYPQQPAQKKPEKRRKKKGKLLPILVAAGVGVVLLAAAIFVASGGGKKLPGKRFQVGGRNHYFDDTSFAVYNETITQEDMKNICRMKKLETLTFSGCTFEGGAKAQLSLLPPTIKYITLEASGITDADLASLPIRSMTELRNVILPGNPDVTDLSVLSSVSGTLTRVDISSTGVKDLSPLSQAAGLLSVSANNCPDLDFSTLDTTGLYTVEAMYSDITDISFLQGSKNLETLRLSGNKISDLSPLAGLTDLRELRLDQNDIRDLTPLIGVTSLHNVDLSENPQLADLTGLEGAADLWRLNLSGDTVKTLAPLQNCKKLAQLDVTGNQLTDLKGLESAIELEELYAANNALTSLDGLENSTILNTVNLRGNQLQDLGRLGKSAEALKKINLSDNKLTDIEELSGSVSLEGLLADNNQITSLAPLKDSGSLKVLSAEHNALTDLAGMEQKERLQCLYVPYNKISDASAIKTLTLSSGTSLKVLSLANNALESLDLNTMIKYEVLVLYGNPMSDYELVRQFSGSEVQISYTDSIKVEGLATGFYHLSVADAPLDKQVGLQKEFNRGSAIKFYTKEELDASNQEIKDRLTASFNCEPYKEKTEDAAE